VSGEGSNVNQPTAIAQDYSPREEFLHAATHGIGALFSVFALIILSLKAHLVSTSALIAVIIYAVSMLMMFGFSTLYHSLPGSRFQPMLKMLDHSAIYFKIAGTYTPFALITLPTLTGVWVMIGIWGAAIFGTVFKVTAFIRKTGKKFSPLSLGVYLAMGWASVFMIGELIDYLQDGGIEWLIAGGLCYTVGAIFYALKKLPYTHTIWHLFVMAGAGCHFVTIYYFVI
jgi:hemolysin III